MRDSRPARCSRPAGGSTGSSLMVRAGLVLSAFLLCGAGLSSAWRLGGAPLWDAWRSRDWTVVEARLEDVRLDYSLGRGTRVSVVYRYHFGGRTYRAGRYGAHDWMDSAEAQREAYADLLYRQRLRALVNPARPVEALLNRDIHWSVVVMSVPALAAAALGGVLLWAAFSGMLAGWRMRRRSQ
ncbi:MAG: DUF3592 domain-containing protein [Zoogloeaceae bacterium]|nr:DUF3592 domain-containing protein [Zoogloeaceae bacterium]